MIYSYRRAADIERSTQPTQLPLYNSTDFKPLQHLLAMDNQGLVRYARHASLDTKTGLLNRSALEKMLHAGEWQAPTSLIGVDVASLRYNNSIDPALGDFALSESGRLIKRAIGAFGLKFWNSTSSFTAVRLGGGKLLIGSPNTNADTLFSYFQSLINDINAGVKQVNAHVPEREKGFELELAYHLYPITKNDYGHFDETFELIFEKKGTLFSAAPAFLLGENVNPPTPDLLIGRLNLEAVNDRATLMQYCTDLSYDRQTELLTDDSLTQCVRNLHTTMGLAVIVGDIKDMKGFNKRYGRKTGNEVIAAVATGFRRGLRKNDLVGRVGGDEFTGVVPRDALNLANRPRVDERIRRFVKEELQRAGHGEVEVRYAIQDIASPENLRQTITSALKRAKMN